MGYFIMANVSKEKLRHKIDSKTYFAFLLWFSLSKMCMIASLTLLTFLIYHKALV